VTGRPEHDRSPGPDACGAVFLVFCVTLLWAFALHLDAGFFWVDDFRSEYIPTGRDIGRALTEGSWPLLTPYSWMTNNLAGEYQYGVFSLFLVPAYALLDAGSFAPAFAAALLVLVHLWILAAGTYALARAYGAPPSYAFACGLLACFNGFIINWGCRTWCPVVFSTAWLPWFWWALRRQLDAPSRRHLAAAGIFLYLVLAGGWPHTSLMAVIVGCCVVAYDCFGGSPVAILRRAAPVACIGLGLSAPAWLSLISYFPETLRSLMRGSYPSFYVPLGALPGLFWPNFRTQWIGFLGNVVRPSIEVFGATAVIPLAFMSYSILEKSRRRDATLVASFIMILAFAFAVSPPVIGSLRWSFRWLPLFFMAVGIAGIPAWNALAARSRNWRIIPAVLQVAISAVTIYFSAISANEILAVHWRYNDYKVALPLEAQRTYLAVGPSIEPAGGLYDPDNKVEGNTQLYAGTTFINGYAAMIPLNYWRLLHPELISGTDLDLARKFLAPSSWNYAALRMAGTDGLLIERSFKSLIPGLLKEGWEQRAADNQWTLLEFPALTAPVECMDLKGAKRTGIVKGFRNARLSAAADVDVKAGNALLVFRRPWQRGYKAWVDGRSVTPQSVDRMVVGIPVEAGLHHVEVRYFPDSLKYGLLLAAGALLLIFLPGGVLPLPALKRKA
jgi:hypothetical protein